MARNRYLIGDLLTGREIEDIPVLTGPWDDNLDTAETVTVTIDLQDPEIRKLDLWNATTPCKTFLGVVDSDSGVIQGAGPIWTRNWDDDAQKLQLGAKGIASYFDHRLILPLLAASIGVDQWTVPDPADNTKTIPNPLLTSSFTGIWLGTIAKRLVQQAQTWTAGNVPIVFQSDESSLDPTNARTYLGPDFKPVGEALQDLTKVIGGPEVNFQPVFTSDGLGVQWLMQVGTAAQPLLFSPSRPFWDLSAVESPVSGLKIDDDGSKMGSWAWFTGGNQTDDVLVSRAYDPTLINGTFPVMDILDTSHQSVSVQSTLDGYSQAAVVSGRTSTEVWSFNAEAHPRDEYGFPAGPQAGEYTTGDFADLYVAPKSSGRGKLPHPEGGTFAHRIIARAGDELGETIRISCAPTVGS